MINDDSQFITKVLSDIDNRTFRLLADCTLNGDSRFSSINHAFLNMTDIPDDIITGKYSFKAVPTCIKSFSSPSSDRNNHSDQSRTRTRDDRNNRQDRNDRNKRQRVDDQDQKVVNSNQHPKLKLNQGENFNTFNNKDFMHLIDKMFCKRWHMKGYCTYNCTRNHEKNASSVPNRVFDNAVNYMVQCRACAA